MSKKNSNLEVEFRKVPSLLFLYEVSEDGRIVRNVKSKHHLKFDTDRGGYYRVSPFIKGKQIHIFVHSLVAECWLGNKPKGYEVDHIDRNRKNNHRKNLRYVTPEGNSNRKIFTEEGKRYILIRKDSDEEYRYFDSKASGARYLSEMTGIKFTTICGRLNAKRKYIGGYEIRYHK